MIFINAWNQTHQQSNGYFMVEVESNPKEKASQSKMHRYSWSHFEYVFQLHPSVNSFFFSFSLNMSFDVISGLNFCWVKAWLQGCLLPIVEKLCHSNLFLLWPNSCFTGDSLLRWERTLDQSNLCLFNSFSCLLLNGWPRCLCQAPVIPLEKGSGKEREVVGHIRVSVKSSIRRFILQRWSFEA